MKSIYAVALVAMFGLVGCQHAPQATTQNKTVNFAELTKPVETNFPTYPQDAPMAIVEFMPILVSQEKQLNLTPEQVKAITEFRKTAMPVRMALQNNLLALRANLRQAILDNAPTAEREALMEQINQTELAHMKARSRCADFVRETLSAEQFAQLVKLYQQKLQEK